MRLLSSVLFVAGVLLVFVGFSTALGYTITSAVASLAAIAALLYAGGTWFAPPRPRSRPAVAIAPILFDRSAIVVSGEGSGQPIAARFPEILRPELERRCAAALTGSGGRFPCLYRGTPVVFEIVPVRDTQGLVVYGLLLQAAADPAAVVVPA